MTYELHLGDCLDVMADLPPSSVNLILADLPYGTTSMAWDSIIDLPTLWRRYTRLLAPGGCIVLFGSQPFTSRLIMSNPEWFKYELIWDKNKCGSPGLAKIRPMKTHENILVFAPGTTVYNPQMETGEPYSRQGSKKIRCNNHGYGFNTDNAIENTGTRYPKSILGISRDFSAQQQVHPTQKPVPLLEWLIASFSNPGDVTLDNVLGSGSTGVAALNLDRKFIGIERDEKYMEIAKERIEAAAGEDLV
jgi:DNA modification methylase